jgi:hypothetical protein
MSFFLFFARLKPLALSLGFAMLLLMLLTSSLLPIAQAAPEAPTAVITVTNIDDSGAGSLRDALLTANDGDTIQFSVSANSVIALTSGELTVTKAITLDGSTATNLAVSGTMSAACSV